MKFSPKPVKRHTPKRTIPRAIFLSIVISVVIYLLVGFVMLSAVQAPDGQPTWRWLKQLGELGIAEAARQFLPYGNVLLLGGVLTTMSARNATVFLVAGSICDTVTHTVLGARGFLRGYDYGWPCAPN